MNFRSRWKEDPEINLIPFIDVLLVILIFLMVTTTYSKYAALQIDLPTANAEKQKEQPNEINVSVNAVGQYTVNRAPLVFTTSAAFADAMRHAGADLKDPLVIINADAKATHQAVINVMEAAREAGYSRVSFSTQQSPAK